MFAKDIMTTNVITVGPDEPVADIARLLIERGISAVPVVGVDGTLHGIVSEGDLVHRVLGDHELPRSWWLSLLGDPKDTPQEYLKSHGKTAADVMTADVIAVTGFTAVSEIAETLETKRIKRVPVVEDGKLKGIVSRANIIQALVAVKETGLPETDASDQEIREAVMAEFDRHAWSGSSTINVVVKDGVVRLWGLVGSEDARKAVHLAAESIDGVKSIEDNLSVADRVPDHF